MWYDQFNYCWRSICQNRTEFCHRPRERRSCSFVLSLVQHILEDIPEHNCLDTSQSWHFGALPQKSFEPASSSGKSLINVALATSILLIIDILVTTGAQVVNFIVVVDLPLVFPSSISLTSVSDAYATSTYSLMSLRRLLAKFFAPLTFGHVSGGSLPAWGLFTI